MKLRPRIRLGLARQDVCVVSPQWPMRAQYLGHVISLDQSEGSWAWPDKTCVLWGATCAVCRPGLVTQDSAGPLSLSLWWWPRPGQVQVIDCGYRETGAGSWAIRTSEHSDKVAIFICNTVKWKSVLVSKGWRAESVFVCSEMSLKKLYFLGNQGIFSDNERFNWLYALKYWRQKCKWNINWDFNVW